MRDGGNVLSLGERLNTLMPELIAQYPWGVKIEQVWFEADLVDGVTLTNSPPTPAPSWGQGFLPVPHPLAVSAGAMIDWKIDVSADGQRWGWTVEPSQLRRDEQSD